MTSRAPGREEPRYLFVLSPPYCGSTLLWKILGTSPAVSSLPREGQSVEGVAHVMPGTTLLEHPEYEVPWSFVKEKWHEKWDQSHPILLEKSPSNIHRAFEIQDRFRSASFVALIRDPYAFCEGCRRRKPHYDHSDAAEFWVRCAKSQRHNVQGLDRVCLVRYEDLTGRTEGVLREIEAFMPELRPLRPDPGPTFTVMGQQSDIRNVNPTKVARLSPHALRTINEALREHEELLSFFGYELRNPSEQSYLRAWRARAATTTIRGVRWMKRSGLVGESTAGAIENLLSP
ncbi:hypothetical protein GGP66_000220 [Salinibacter ruber]|uniref:sulfotransferase family protein n=1 Tax=Salinibacter ruber TaxID=146919 RepID=UPI00216967D5|nr:sulfotransferase [Salinibacter ruber]MCS3672816.1 hypothetical protein [Salinibacter ruber]